MVLEKDHYIVEEQFLGIIDEYFGLDLIIEDIREDFRFFVDEFKEINDFTSVCSKDEAISYIKDHFDTNNIYIDIYISREIINIWDIKDAFSKNIFQKHGLMQGWFIWVDSCNIANWSHECYYYFIIDKSSVYKSTEQWIPHEDIIIDKVS